MDTITKTMLSCESKFQLMHDMYKDMGQSLQLMGLLHKIERELAGNESAAALGIKQAIKNNTPAKQIIKECAEQIRDGWKALSIPLSNQIKTFYNEQIVAP